MPGDEEILTSKIFLNRASARSKAKSWLKTSTNEETASASQSTTKNDTVDDDLTAIIVSDELSGIGVPSKAGNDDPSNRQLMSANDILRRKLLSKDAYKRFSAGKLNGAEASRSKAKKAEIEDEPQEEKGKSSRNAEPRPQNAGIVTVDDTKHNAVPMKPISKNKKRPSSYLDELLAGRQSKQQKKAKRKSDDD